MGFGDGKDLEMTLARGHLLNHLPWPNLPVSRVGMSDALREGEKEAP